MAEGGVGCGNISFGLGVVGPAWAWKNYTGWERYENACQCTWKGDERLSRKFE